MTKKEITIEYARQQLSKKGIKMTDEQINNLLNYLRFLSNKTIDSVIEIEN